MTDQILEALPYWHALTEIEKSRVRETASVRCFCPGEILYGYNVSCIGMIHVLKGETRAYVLSREGREIQLFRVKQGDNCILSAACVLAHISFESTMVAVALSEILVVPVTVFEGLCEHNIHVRCFAYELATQRFSTVMSVMQMILFSSLDARLATYLYQEYQRNSGALLRLTHEQIAQNINSAREAVSRALKRFSGDGLIECGRGIIRIRDSQALRMRCEELDCVQKPCLKIPEM